MHSHCTNEILNALIQKGLRRRMRDDHAMLIEILNALIQKGLRHWNASGFHRGTEILNALIQKGLRLASAVAAWRWVKY